PRPRRPRSPRPRPPPPRSPPRRPRRPDPGRLILAARRAAAPQGAHRRGRADGRDPDGPPSSSVRDLRDRQGSDAPSGGRRIRPSTVARRADEDATRHTRSLCDRDRLFLMRSRTWTTVDGAPPRTRRPLHASATRPGIPRPLSSGAFVMSHRTLPPESDARPLSLSRRTLMAATAAAVPAGAVALGAAPALADPTVTDGETRVVDVPLADAPLVEADGVQVRDLPEQPGTMVGVTWPSES